MRTILVIDDDDGVRSTLALLLRKHDWRVLEARDGREGIELARTRQPQAILCDLLMPGINGFRVCAAVRSDPALRYCLVLAMSGRGFEDNRRTALEAGADEFLPKPIQTEHLLELLNTIAGRTPTRPAWPETDEEDPQESSPPVVRFWGVRGSVPVPGPATVRYGGNTACVEFRASGKIVILDAGTGLRPLGESLVTEFGGRLLDLTLLISHAHWDHVQGFPFFRPLYEPSCRLQVLGFDTTGEGLAAVFARQMETPYFPIALHELPARVRFEEKETMAFQVGSIQVQAAFVNHPGVCVAYRLNADGISVAYLPDHEPFHRTCLRVSRPGVSAAQAAEFAGREDERIDEFLRDVDVLVLDAQFNTGEYQAHIGWGHSSVDDAVALAIRARAGQLFLFHHNPTHTDEEMDRMEQHARKVAAASGGHLEVAAAREGTAVEWGEPRPKRKEQPTSRAARKKP